MGSPPPPQYESRSDGTERSVYAKRNCKKGRGRVSTPRTKVAYITVTVQKGNDYVKRLIQRTCSTSFDDLASEPPDHQILT